MARYHADVYLPKLPAATFTLFYSYHAKEAALDDGYANLQPFLPRTIETQKVRMVEVDTHVNAKGREIVDKLLVRFSIGNGLDLCMVLLAQPNGAWLVKTVYANRSDDTHRTLRNRSDFETGPRKA